ADLAAELVGGLGPARLVLDVLLVPERRRAAFEGHGDLRGLLVAQHVDQHRGEAVDGVGRQACGRREVLHRERAPGPVGERGAVEKQQRIRHPWQSIHALLAPRAAARSRAPRPTGKVPGGRSPAGHSRCVRSPYPEKAKTVVESKVLPGPRVVDGTAGWFGGSGKCWVSKVMPGARRSGVR